MRPGEIEYQYETSRGVMLSAQAYTPISPEYYVRYYPTMLEEMRQTPLTEHQKQVIPEMERKLAEARRAIAEKESACA